MEGDWGLFNIDISSFNESPTNEKTSRDFQSEEDFQAVRKEWKPRVESGEIWKTLKLPINNLSSKTDNQIILHAVEELYFFRRYEEADRVTIKAIEGELSDDLRKTLLDYQKRCRAKLVISGSTVARDQKTSQ